MIAIKKPAEIEEFIVVHPMFDVPEQKCDGANLGQIAMSPPVRLCLIGLRIYLIGMGAVLAYHMLDLAGLIGHGIK